MRRLLSIILSLVATGAGGADSAEEGWMASGGAKVSSSSYEEVTRQSAVVKKGELEKAIQAEIVKPLSVPEEPYPEGYMVARVRLTNPNDYAVAFVGRGSSPSIRIGEAWHRLEDGKWKEYEFNFCGTGLRSYRLEPGASEEVTFFFPPWRPQRAILTLRHAEKPEYQSIVAIVLTEDDARVE